MLPNWLNFVENTIFHKIENSTTAVCCNTWIILSGVSFVLLEICFGSLKKLHLQRTFCKNLLFPPFKKNSNGIWTDVAGFWGFRLEYVGIKYWCQIIQYVYVNHLKSVFFMALRLWYRCHSIFMFLISIFYHNIEEKATHGSVEVQISWENPYQKGRWKS